MLRQTYVRARRASSVLFCRTFFGLLIAVALIGFRAPARAQNSTADGAGLGRFDTLNERGWVIPHPSVADTLVGDSGGVRSTLADAGIGFMGFVAPNLFEYDLTQANAGKPLAVNGQVGTWNDAIQSLTVTFDLGRAGRDGGQLIVTGLITDNSLQKVNGPDVNRIRNLAYNQIFTEGKISIQAGYYANDLHFVGSEVGGSLAAGVLGPQAFIPNEVGLSYLGFGTPAAEIKFDLPGGFYDRAGVQRSLPPGGGAVEARINPGAGLRFAPPGTDALFINEMGYEKAPSASQAYAWIRIGGIYNRTLYPNFTNGHGVANWAVYALADRQLTTISSKQPIRGLYVGGSVMYAPPEQNLFTQYYEARIYDYGPFNTRQGDFASIVLACETYSKEGRNALAPPSVGSFAATTTITGSYAFRVRPGLYLQPGLGVTIHPSFSRLYNDSFDVYLAINAFL